MSKKWDVKQIYNHLCYFRLGAAVDVQRHTKRQCEASGEFDPPVAYVELRNFAVRVQGTAAGEWYIEHANPFGKKGKILVGDFEECPQRYLKAAEKLCQLFKYGGDQ